MKQGEEKLVIGFRYWLQPFTGFFSEVREYE